VSVFGLGVIFAPQPNPGFVSATQSRSTTEQGTQPGLLLFSLLRLPTRWLGGAAAGLDRLLQGNIYIALRFFVELGTGVNGGSTEREFSAHHHRHVGRERCSFRPPCHCITDNLLEDQAHPSLQLRGGVGGCVVGCGGGSGLRALWQK